MDKIPKKNYDLLVDINKSLLEMKERLNSIESDIIIIKKEVLKTSIKINQPKPKSQPQPNPKPNNAFWWY